MGYIANEFVIYYLLTVSSFIRLSSTRDYECFGNHCPPSEYCIIKFEKNVPQGQCIEEHDENLHKNPNCSLYFGGNIHNLHTCICHDNACVSGIRLAMSSQYKCLSQYCFGSDFCLLHSGSGDNSNQIVSQCVQHMPVNALNCTSHDSLMIPGGCYCNSLACVNNIAIHTHGISCRVDQGVTYKLNSGKLTAVCEKDPHLHECSPLDLHGYRTLPCFCHSQMCANMMEGQSTVTPLHTTTISTQSTVTPLHTTTISSYTEILCISEKCNTTFKYCQLVAYSGAIIGRCLMMQAGFTECTTSIDLEHNGCICTTDRCITNTITHYANSHLTTQTTTTATTTPLPTTTTPLPTTTTPLPTTMTTTNTTSATTTPVVVSTAPPGTQTPTMSTSGYVTNIDFSTTTFVPSTTQSTVISIPPSTTQPPTLSPAPTTLLASTRKCHICGDQGYGMPCSMKEINNSPETLCTSGDYCMTDIFQDAHGNLDVYKRCVDMVTCEKEWIHETADHDYCKQYGTILNPGVFSCHFCCNSDGCNSNILPSTSTWYSTQNGR